MEGTTMAGDAMVADGGLVDVASIQPCVRHISSVQIRNLSPFPTRDSLASILTQRPAVAAAGSGLASDDADILLGRRRKRRISSASIRSLKSIHSDHEHDPAPSHTSIPSNSHVRNRTNSRAIPYVAGGSSSSSSTKRQSHMSPAEHRQRQRKASEDSLPEDTLPSWQEPTSTSTSSSWFTDTLNSQRELEDAIWSRLVETFLTINLPQDDDFPPTSPTVSPSLPKPQGHGRKDSASRRLKNSVDLDLASPSATNGHSRRQTPSISSAATASSPSGSPFTLTTTNKALQSSASPSKATFPQSPPLTPPPIASTSATLVPIYISPFHRPSTNPKFVLDQDDPAFAQCTNLSTDEVVIRIWARLGQAAGIPEYTKIKEKTRLIQDDHVDRAVGGWKVLGEWDLNLSDLMPLPDDFIERPWKLPANTLVLTLHPSNRPYYLPSTLLGVPSTPSRPSSPCYNSDSEVSRRRSSAKNIFSLHRGRQRKSRRELKTANLNELVKLVSLQASLLDARNLLQEIVESCNRLVKEDSSTVLRRESSEREYRLQCLQERRDLLDDNIRSARDSMSSRKEKIRQRRMRLAEARALHEDDLLTEFDAGVRLAEEKKRVKALKGQIEPVRTSLLSTLAFIFPIELLSPPDLLYTILGVPLPIPLQGSDPAPPLLLPQVPAVSEDGVASALGYAALLVHLMAAYLCQRLVYPVTYIGSRSLVKDPISAMMGPRMFPLYSKGVDTYRFEYAVFLLNKDIEMLMAERNLRALDLRHTLPNLKNLLLTLTSGEGALPRSRVLTSPSVVSITPGLQSPNPYAAGAADTGESEPPPLVLESDEVGSSTTPKGRAVGLPRVDDDLDIRNNTGNGNSDTREISTTSSAAAEDASDMSPTSTSEDKSGTSSTLRPRLPRIQIQSYLGLAPLSSMWRGRGVTSFSGASSSKPSVSGDMISNQDDSSEPSASRLGLVHDGVDVDGSGDAAETTSESGEDSDDDDDDDDDRCTVRGSSVPTTPNAGNRSRHGSAAPESLLDNLKDLKTRLRGGGGSIVNTEAEKRLDLGMDKDGDMVVDTAC